MPPRPSFRVANVLERATNPPILPIPRRTSGNNVPHSMHKTRRSWKPNVARYNLPVNVIGGALHHAAEAEAAGGRARYPQLSGVKMTARGIKSVMKAGGVEGMLLSRPAKHFTPEGRALRHELFTELHRVRAMVQEETAEAARELSGVRLIEDGAAPKA